ncbi:MAG: type IV pilus assembly protein PilM [Candidatus Moranbacteria bacterium]|nr:type IV pilus assembly protein PilM [Candidatus Moranbacteria bacterium]
MKMFAKERFLGVDFGTESIKAVELGVRGGKPFVSNYGEALLFSGQGKNTATRSLREEIAIRFRSLLDRMHPDTNEVCISMPSFLGLISLIDFPEMTEAELEEAVQFEARKYIPSPLEDVALSWEAVGDTHDSEKAKKTEVLLVAALNKDVHQYESYVNVVGYDMKLLELETFSIARSLAGNEPDPVLVVDIGARAANLILVENGFPKKSRSIDSGGRDITRTLAESLNISIDRADEMKKSGKDFLNAKDIAIIFPPVETIVSEAKRMIVSWEEKRPSRTVKKLILSGGTGRLAGLVEYTSKKVGVPVVIGNPFEGVSVPSELDAQIDQLGASFSAAIGLALYGIRSAEKK